MRRGALLLALVCAACSYNGRDVAPDAPTAGDDAAATIDAAVVDATPVPPCVLGVGGGTTDRGKVGLSNGGSQGSIECDGDARIVGLALDMSDGLADGVTPSARGIRIACATVTIDGTGGHVTNLVTKDKEGAGGAGWSPSTWTPLARCADDAVVTGLAVHGSSYVSYFLDATMQCTQLDATGAPVQTAVVDITGSGTDPSSPSEAHCNSGEQVAEMTTWTGAGLDSVRLQCAATTCE
jgi:hypothetical protein